MAKEIERKFLVKSSDYKQLSHRKTEIAQAYLSPDKRATVRVRITDDLAYLTVKGKKVYSAYSDVGSVKAKK